MASTDATAIPIKNQAYRVSFPIFDADGDLVTGATGLDSEISKDGGTFADCTNEATEIATNSGMYYLDLSSTEMNADTVAIIVKTTSSGAKTTPLVLYPAEAADIIVNVKQVNGTAQTAGDLAANQATIAGYIDTEVGAIKAKTDQLVFTTANRVDSQVHGMQSGTVTAAAIATDAIDADALADDAASEIANKILDLSAGVETGLTVRQAIRLMVAAVAGKVSGGGTTTITIRNYGDSKDRIIATVVPSTGNRTAITYDLS